MRKSTIAALTVAAVFIPALASAAMPKTVTIRERAEALCYSDVMRLCNDVVPDEDQIAACMKGKHAQLSTECRDVYDQGMQAAK